MNATKSTKTGGAHTVSFIIVVPVTLIVLYVIGLLIHPANLSNQLTFVLWVLFRLVMFAALAVLLNLAFYTAVLRQTPRDILMGLRRFEHSTGLENLSRAFVLVGLLMIAAQLVGWPLATSMKGYLYEILTKGSLGLLLATAVTMFGALFLGIKSVDHFAEYFNDPRNNQIVLVVMALVNLAVFIAMR